MRATSSTTSAGPSDAQPRHSRRLDVGIALIALMIALFVAQLLWVVTTRTDGAGAGTETTAAETDQA